MKFSLLGILDLKKDRNSFPSDSLRYSNRRYRFSVYTFDSRRTQLASYLLAILVARSRLRDLKVARTQTATLKGNVARSCIVESVWTSIRSIRWNERSRRKREERKLLTRIYSLTIFPDFSRSFESKESNFIKWVENKWNQTSRVSMIMDRRNWIMYPVHACNLYQPCISRCYCYRPTKFIN